MSKLADLQGREQALRSKMAEVYAQAGNDFDFSNVTCLGDGDTKAKVEQFNQLDAELNDAHDAVMNHMALIERKDQFDEGQRVDTSSRAPTAVQVARRHAGLPEERDAEYGGEPKSLGRMFVESVAYKDRDKRDSSGGPFATVMLPNRAGDMKATLFQTSAGFAPESVRSGRVVEKALRPIQVTDLLPTVRTSQAAIVYMEETTATNAAAETAEAGTYPESALVYAQQTATVRKIATFIPVTDEQLEDVDGMEDRINGRLAFFIEQRLDSQLLVGDGIAPNLLGINNKSGIQTQAKGADPVPDAIYKAMTLVNAVGRATVSGVVIHPYDWQDVKLLRTADGVYIWGNPADASPDRIWGIPVAISDAQTQNTAVVGDFRNWSELAIRRDVDVQVSNSHSTYFIEGKQAIRADMRAAALWYRAAAFCTVTGV